MSKPIKIIDNDRASGWWARIVLVFIACLPPVLHAADLEGLRLWRAPDHTRLVIDLSAQVDYKIFNLDSPRRVVVDIDDVRVQAALSSVDLKSSPIKKLRGASRDNGDFRLVLDLVADVRPKAFFLAANRQYGDRLVIDLYDKSVRKHVVKTVPDLSGKRDIVIAIDPGHGGEDPGASGPGRIREKQVVLQIARELKARIDRLPGYRATLVRDGDYYVGLGKRRAIARKRRADLFISIHADAFKDKRVAGSSVYTLSQKGASSASAKAVSAVPSISSTRLPAAMMMS